MQIVALTSSKGGVGTAFGRQSGRRLRTARSLRSSGRRLRHSDQPPVNRRRPVPSPAGRQRRVPERHRTRSVVIDSKDRPALADVVNLSKLAGMLLIPTAPTGNEVKATGALQSAEKDMAHVRVVVTLANPSCRVGHEARDHLRPLGLQVCTTAMRSYAAFQRAEEQNLLVTDVLDDRAANAWADMCAVALEVS